MGGIEARDSARPDTSTDVSIHTNWDVLSGTRHFVPQPIAPVQQKPAPQPDYLKDICQNGGLAMYRDPFNLSWEACNNFQRFDLNKDGKLSLPEIKLIENSTEVDNDDRKLAFALDRGFPALQAISGGHDAITKDGLLKFNHIEDSEYIYALEHHGGSGLGLLSYLGTAIGTGALCWRLGLSFWPTALAATAAATAAFLLVERPHNRQQDAELHDLRALQPNVDELIKSVQKQLPKDGKQ